MTKTQQILEHVIVTFVEAAGAYLIVIPTVNWTKTAVAGAVGAGLSGVYNLLRQSSPTIISQTAGYTYVPPQSNATQGNTTIPQGTTFTPISPSAKQDDEDAILDNLANEPEEPALLDPPDSSPTV